MGNVISFGQPFITDQMFLIRIIKKKTIVKIM